MDSDMNTEKNTKTCEVCNVKIHKSSFSKHLKSKTHLINNGEYKYVPVCYIRLKQFAK